jgi:hypothetical protein
MMPKYTPRVVNVPLTVSLAAYTAGDSVGNDATDAALVSASVGQIDRGGGYIAWVRLTDAANQAEAYKLWCFYEQPSAVVDAAPYVPLLADLQKLFTKIAITSYDQTGADAGALSHGKDIVTGEYMMFPHLTNDRMYFYLVCDDTPDYAATDDLQLDICFMVLR